MNTPERIDPFATRGVSDADHQATDFACAILMPEAPFRAAYLAHQGRLLALARAFGVPYSAAHRRAAMLALPAGAHHPAAGRWAP